MAESKDKSHHKPKAYFTLKTGHPIDEPPEYLEMMAKQCYQKVVQDLRDMGVADRSDSRAVEAYAAAYGEYRMARHVVMSKGMTYETIDKKDAISVVKRPEVEIMNAAWVRMRSLLPELYLTPASRAKAPGAGKTVNEDKWDDLIPGDTR